MRKMYRKIGGALNKLGGKGLSRIDVPDARAATEGSGDPDDPKHWKGPWKSVTNPVEIAQEVCKVNASNTIKPILLRLDLDRSHNCLEGVGTLQLQIHYLKVLSLPIFPQLPCQRLLEVFVLWPHLSLLCRVK
jgi:hypothetical protein